MTDDDTKLARLREGDRRIAAWERPMYFDRQGAPIWDTLKWARLIEDRQYQRVARDTLPVPGRARR